MLPVRECAGPDHSPARFRQDCGQKSEAKPVKLDGGTRIVCREKDAGFQRQARLLQQFYQAEQDCPGGDGGTGAMKDASLKQYGPEAYRLEAAPGNIVIKAAAPKGVLRRTEPRRRCCLPRFLTMARTRGG